MSFKHGNNEITVTPSGEFMTTLHGKVVRAPSLAAMKKKLDAAAKVNFEPFIALRDKRYNDKEGVVEEMVRVKVIGIEKSTATNRYLRQKWVFVIENNGVYGGSWDELTVDTPENLAAVKALNEYRAETLRIKAEREAKLIEMENAIATVKADDYAKV